MRPQAPLIASLTGIALHEVRQSARSLSVSEAAMNTRSPRALHGTRAPHPHTPRAGGDSAASSSRVFWRQTQLRPPNAALVRSAILLSIHAAVAAARDSRPRALPGGPRCSPFCAQNATCFVARVGGTGARAASRESRSLWGLVPKPWEASVPRAEWRKRAGRWNAIRWARPRGAREHGATDGAVVEAGGRRRPPVCLS